MWQRCRVGRAIDAARQSADHRDTGSRQRAGKGARIFGSGWGWVAASDHRHCRTLQQRGLSLREQHQWRIRQRRQQRRVRRITEWDEVRVRSCQPVARGVELSRVRRLLECVDQGAATYGPPGVRLATQQAARAVELE